MMELDHDCLKFENSGSVLHWNFRGYTEFPIDLINNNSEDVTDLYLKENRITGFPTDLYRLRSLESLYLTGNEIYRIPPEIALLQTLKCLDLSGNCLRDLPEELGDLENLRYCILDVNKITELPINLNRLKNLRILSVCDNHLTWLAQKPVFNSYICEFKFWRNKYLNHVPYHIWLTILRCQLRCVNIGCFEYNQNHADQLSHNTIVRIQNQLCFPNESTAISFPSAFNVVTVQNTLLPPAPLRELCIRKIYKIALLNTEKSHHEDDKNRKFDNKIINLYLQHLPRILAMELSRGPRMFCDHLKCAKPLFNFAIVDFVKSELKTLDETKEIILSVTCCSQYCHKEWKLTHINSYVQPLSWKTTEIKDFKMHLPL